MKEKLIHSIGAIARECGFPVEPEAAAESLLLYIEEWRKWNARINLTAEKDAESLIDRHILNSLYYMKGIETPRNILDIGSGGGFPGLPVKAVLPAVPMTLIESNRKRAAFLRQAVRSMGLREMDVLHLRAEQAAGIHSTRYDTVLLRAVGSLEDCLNWSAPFLHPGGRIVIQKEPEAQVPDSVRQNPRLPALTAEIPLAHPSGPRSKLMIFEAGSM